MGKSELRLRAEWGAIKAEEEGFLNTRDALLEIAKMLLKDPLEEPASLFGVRCLEHESNEIMKHRHIH